MICAPLPPPPYAIAEKEPPPNWLGVIALLLVTSVFGWLELNWTVVLHEGSSLVVVLNALRLLGYKKA